MRHSLLAIMSCILLTLTSCGDSGGSEPGLPPQSTLEPASTPIAAPTQAAAGDGVAVIALNANGLEEFPVAVFWTGEEGDGPMLPSGYWHVITSDDDGIRRTGEAVAVSGEDAFPLELATETIPGDGGEAGAAFEQLASYILTAHASYLASLNVLSGGFAEAPFDPAAEVDGDSARQFRLLSGELAAISGSAGRAVEVLGRERFVAANAGPSAGLFDWLRDQIDDPIKAQDRAKKARQDLELAFGRMTLAEQQEAFRQLKDERGLEIDAADSATFIEALTEGDYDNLAAQARNYLQNHEDYFQHFDLRNIETARDEAAQLVTDGAQFYAQAIKEVLVKKFPGLEHGWDAIEELEEKLQRLQNPEIKVEDVQALMNELGYEISLEEAESIVQTVQYSYDLLVAKVSKPAATPTAGAQIDGGWGVYDTAPIEKARGGLIGPLVAEVDNVNTILICGLSGGGLCEGANATTTLEQAGGVVLILGPFESYEDAVRAYCDNIVAGSQFYANFVGQMAKMKHDGENHALGNGPAC